MFAILDKATTGTEDIRRLNSAAVNHANDQVVRLTLQCEVVRLRQCLLY
jgi:hypothetical protein